MVLQLQQSMELQSEQIQNLQALSEVEVIKAQSKAQADDKNAALGIAQLQEDARQFNITASQKAVKQDEDVALKITDLELSNNTDLQGGIDEQITTTRN